MNAGGICSATTHLRKSKKGKKRWMTHRSNAVAATLPFRCDFSAADAVLLWDYSMLSRSAALIPVRIASPRVRLFILEIRRKLQTI